MHRRSSGQSGANEVARAAQINGADIAWRRSRGAAYEHAHAAIHAIHAIHALHPLADPLVVIATGSIIVCLGRPYAVRRLGRLES